MNKRSTLTLGIIFILLIGFLWWYKPAPKAVTQTNFQPASGGVGNLNQTVLTSTETNYDFGTIRMRDGLVSRVFKVSNPTDKEVLIKTVYSSCMCTTAFTKVGEEEKGPFRMPGMGYVPPANQVIKPGETMEVKMVFDPNAHGPAGVGFIDRFATLTDADGKQMQLEIKALVTP